MLGVWLNYSSRCTFRSHPSLVEGSGFRVYGSMMQSALAETETLLGGPPKPFFYHKRHLVFILKRPQVQVEFLGDSLSLS